MLNTTIHGIKIATGKFFTVPYVFMEKQPVFACEWLSVKALPVRLQD
jgi:hypothetical protein